MDKGTINFQKAVQIAKESIPTLLGKVKNVDVESVLIKKNFYEVTLSYDKSYDDTGILDKKALNGNIGALVTLMGRRRGEKIFLIDKYTGEFCGFSNKKIFD